MTGWLLEESWLRHLEHAHERGAEPTAEQRRRVDARANAQSGSVPSIYSVRGDTATITVTGILTRAPDVIAMIIGGNTAYIEIERALAAAEQDASVRQITLQVDSPGGEVDGLFDTLAAIEATSKPMSVQARNALSAAYGIAASAGSIEAANEASQFGSVGVAASALVHPQIVHVTSTDAPKKRPDLSTEEGRNVVREHLDAIFELFADAIARGRGTSVDNVKNQYGKGAVLLANDAIARGMIDTVSARAGATGSQASATGREGTGSMDKEQLKSQFPQVARELVEEGRKEERDRTVAHLDMGSKAGDLESALKAVRAGDPLTQSWTAFYMNALANRRDRDIRQTETDEAGAVADGAAGAPSDGGADLGDEVVRVLQQQGEIE